jgi:hypothetical protein
MRSNMLQRVIPLLKVLAARLRLLLPTTYPTSLEGVGALAQATIAAYGISDAGFESIAKRRVAEAVLRGANSRVIVMRLRFYLEIRMALSAGAGFSALEVIKQEEKERERKRQEELKTANA